MKYSNLRFIDTANGTGVRVSLFVSGCRNHCKGCFSPQTWNFEFGEDFTPIQENEIIEACKKSYIDGLTIIGGDPFEKENQLSLLSFIKKFKTECPDKTLWMYTGYILDKDLKRNQRQFIHGVTDRILSFVDVLVDGPFEEDKKDLTLQFRGSSNQRLLDKNQIEELSK